MNLQEYSDVLVPTPSLSDVRSRATRLWEQTQGIIGNETRTDPTVAAALCQIVLLTDEFAAALRERDMDPRNDGSREVILLNRSKWSEYVLLVADDRFDPVRSPGDYTLNLGAKSLQSAVRQWRKALSGRPERYNHTDLKLLDVLRTVSSAEVLHLDRFPVYFIRRPRLIPTSAPTPAWEVTSSSIGGRATAGCMVRHADGRRVGVTTVRHFFPMGTVTGTAVDANGSTGTVAVEDLISDSVFIEMPSVPPPAGRRGVKGWLKGVSPRRGEPAIFDGATSHRVTTAVMGEDPGVTQVSPYRQARIYTAAVTNPGDSGAALIEDSTDLIMGFAKERTEAGALIEWSSWIWADSVFAALNVSPT